MQTIPEGVKSIGDNAFSWCDKLKDVICYTPYVVSAFNELEYFNLIYPSGPITDLPYEFWINAASGFIYALEEGIKEFEQWREGYMEYIRNNVRDVIEYAEHERHVLLFLINENLLDEETTKHFMKQYEGSDDSDVNYALQQYYRENF